jgi:hypothetical protein
MDGDGGAPPDAAYVEAVPTDSQVQGEDLYLTKGAKPKAV